MSTSISSTASNDPSNYYDLPPQQQIADDEKGVRGHRRITKNVHNPYRWLPHEKKMLPYWKERLQNTWKITRPSWTIAKCLTNDMSRDFSYRTLWHMLEKYSAKVPPTRENEEWSLSEFLFLSEMTHNSVQNGTVAEDLLKVAITLGRPLSACQEKFDLFVPPSQIPTSIEYRTHLPPTTTPSHPVKFRYFHPWQDWEKAMIFLWLEHLQQTNQWSRRQCYEALAETLKPEWPEINSTKLNMLMRRVQEKGKNPYQSRDRSGEPLSTREAQFLWDMAVGPTGSISLENLTTALQLLGRLAAGVSLSREDLTQIVKNLEQDSSIEHRGALLLHTLQPEENDLQSTSSTSTTGPSTVTPIFLNEELRGGCLPPSPLSPSVVDHFFTESG